MLTHLAIGGGRGSFAETATKGTPGITVEKATDENEPAKPYKGERAQKLIIKF